MIHKIVAYYNKQQFQPRWFSIFINPFFIIRKQLFKGVEKSAFKLKGKLLDIGCGTKPYIELFKEIDEYIGIDIENDGHSHETEQIDVFYDGKTIPFSNNSYDVVFSSEVFEHVFEIDDLLIEIKRVLKPNGELLITVPFTWDEHEIPNDYGRYTSFGIKYLLEKHGFEIIKQDKTGDFFKVMIQLSGLYLHHIINTRNKYINMLLNFIFVAPILISGLFLSLFLPKKESLYFNNIVLAKNIKNEA